MRVEFCASCGAPLEARWAEIVIVCSYCGCHNAPGPRGQPIHSAHPADGRPRFAAGGRTYVVEGRLGSGDACEVYRGRWVMRLGEAVVIKVLRALEDADLLRREWDVLARLHRSTAQGASHFVTRLPQPVTRGLITSGGLERAVSIFRWRSGFQHTLEEVLTVHPDGVDGRVVVWLLKRLLELLGFVHQAGFVHGAVLPPHVLVHPRDHGAILIGWTTAATWARGRAERLPAVSAAWEAFYPEALWRERWPSPASDLAMAARCALAAAGGTPDGARTGSLQGVLGEVVRAAARGEHPDAWALREQVDRASAEVHGPPSYNPLPMPGWSIPG